MKIAFNIEEMRPGCALLQAAFGGEMGIANRFPVETWDLNPTKLQLYEVNNAQLEELIIKSTLAHLEPEQVMQTSEPYFSGDGPQ